MICICSHCYALQFENDSYLPNTMFAQFFSSVVRCIFLLLIMVSTSQPAFSQPKMELQRNTVLLDQALPSYRFTSHIITAQNNHRQYELFIGIPFQSAPANGYAVLYALDGNAVISQLNAKMLNTLHHPPVIVAIGTPSPLLFDGDARTYDYTPALPSGDTVDPAHNRPAGGAEFFTQTLAHQIKPYVASLAKINSAKEFLWGHSYAGLFVLHTFFLHTELFTHYIAASPSLWWQNGLILQEEVSFTRNLSDEALSKELWLMQGGKEAEENIPSNKILSDAAKKMIAARTVLPADSLEKMHQRLTDQKLHVHYDVLEGLSHGSMFAAALQQALHIVDTD